MKPMNVSNSLNVLNAVMHATPAPPLRRALVRLAALAIAAIASFVPGAPGTRASAQENGFGLGVIVGEPTGVSLKGWMSGSSALAAGVAWSFSHETTFHVHLDYLMHSFKLISEDGRLPLYYGVGGRIKTGGSGDDRVGIRGVIGVGYFFSDAPLDAFVEIVPVLDLSPEVDVEFNGGIGMRYFFR